MVSKNKLRKEKRLNHDRDEEQDNEVDQMEDEVAKKKRKRLALYGLK